MSRTALVAVLDVGKTVVKVCLVDPAGRVVAGREAPAEPGPALPYPSLNPDATRAFMLGALRELVAERHGDVQAVVPVAHGAAAALLAGDRLALPMLDYEHAQTEENAGDYEAPPFAETFSPPLPAGLNLGRQLHYLERRFPESFARVTEILPYPQYLATLLGGRRASEVTSLGCHTDLWAPAARTFSSLARKRGWADRFAPVLPAWTPLGELSPAVARATGLPSSCVVLAGLHDSNATYLAHSIGREPPFSVVSTGTWVICLSAGTGLERLDAESDMLANVDVFGAPVPTARFMGGREMEHIAGGTGSLSTLEPADVAAVVRSGVRALPSFAREGGPFRGRPGTIEGPAPATERERAALAVLYAALMTDYCLERLGARGPVIVDGGLTRTPVYAPLMAALRRESPVRLASERSGTAPGAALLARFPILAPPDTTRPVVPLDIAGLAEYRAGWRARLTPNESRRL